jgi:hypothetical protein
LGRIRGDVAPPVPLPGIAPDEDRYVDGSNMMEMDLECYNPVGNSSLTSLIQVVSVHNQEFWFTGLVNYDSAVKNL